MNPPTVAQITWARGQVKLAREAGVDDATIDQQLQQALGVGLKEILSFTGRDAARSAAAGLTLGFNDELAGGLAKLTGGDYTKARDEVRANDAGAKYASPYATAGVELAGGMVPALATLPFGGEGAAAEIGPLARMGKAALTSGLFGAATGAGHSEAETPMGVAGDAAKTGAASAAIGGGLSLLGSGAGAVAKKFRGPQAAVLKAGASQLPPNAAKTLATQEALAPGTAVAADLSPEMSAMTSGVGADPKAGMLAREAAKGRVDELRKTLSNFGKQYQQVNRTLPVDPELQAILAEGAKQGIKPAGKLLAPDATAVEFSTLHRFRSNLLADLRHIKDNSMKKHDKSVLAEKLTDWMSQHVPEIIPLDKGNSFLNKALSAAEETLDNVTKSSLNYARTSVKGGPTPFHRPGPWDMVSRALQSKGGDRARATATTMLDPKNTKSSVEAMLRFQAALGKPMSGMQRVLAAGLFGNAVPRAGQGLMQQ